VTVLQGEVGVASSNAQNASSSAVVGLTAGMQMQTANYAMGTLGPGATGKPMALSMNQLSTLASSAKVSDTIFQKAVTIDPAQPSDSTNRDPASSGSGTVKPAITTTVAIPPPPPVSPAALGVPGAFAPNTAIAQTPVNPLGSLKRLHVVILTP
jgi:hypothetical protein